MWPKVSFDKAKSIDYGKLGWLFSFDDIIFSIGFHQRPRSGARNKYKPVHATTSVLKIGVACTCMNVKLYRHVTLTKRLLCIRDNETTIPSDQFEQII